MLETLSRYWWAVAVRGAAAVVFGLAALVWPGITLFVLVALFGAFALVDGAVTLGTALIRNRDRPDSRGSSRGWLLAQGVAGILIGMLTFAWPDVTAVALLWLIAAWAVATGVLEILTAVRLRRELRHEWLLALSGALSVVFGILLIAWPAAGALAVVTIIGIYGIVFGVSLVALGIRMRRVRAGQPRAAGTRHRPATA
jgi:uncharacterized membrane protein HdeD (DUF308 family)